jgi:hypothetical protein
MALREIPVIEVKAHAPGAFRTKVAADATVSEREIMARRWEPGLILHYRAAARRVHLSFFFCDLR